MSHVATVDIEVKDLDALASAAKRLGLEFVRDQKDYRWYGQHVGDYPLPEGFKPEDLGVCDHAIRIPGDQQAYEIGVVKRRDGRPGYMLLWDFFGGGYGLEKKVGQECKLLRQNYAAIVTAKQARLNGFAVTEQKLPNGLIRLQMSK